MEVTEAEAQVMAVLWQAHPRGADEIVQALAGTGWAPATVKTLLNRLLTKGAIRATRDGRRYLYSPVLVREEWLGQQSEGLVDRLFGGRVAPLVAHFGERGRLSREDIAELRRLLEELDDGH
ncbi:BlaI/MecI/CopY family transcriptional regulator [Xanthomonas massiliensis]|jgi:predicted transcriptional regulator|uniref:BlaI/MecI/CopY family transcriptional regulator n=1 Tax=Xanthomonas massiliensis TaxID=1720302 RepID=UPI00082576F6|nr:BlaI/MecI/CopY family transcriptional regulator [Xanthomonas massiliensis]